MQALFLPRPKNVSPNARFRRNRGARGAPQQARARTVRRAPFAARAFCADSAAVSSGMCE